MSAPSPLVIVPCDARTPEDLDVAARCLVSIAMTAPGAEVVVLADPDAEPAVRLPLEAAAAELGFGFGVTPLRQSLGAGLNPALEEARDDGRDAVVVSSDVELPGPGWLDALLARRDSSGVRPAAVVGGLLLYPQGVIEHAGLQFSMLKHRFVERHRLGPATLEEARVPRCCPVGPGLVLLRHDALLRVGLLAEDLPDAELPDYCLRCFAAGLECVYEPAATGVRNRSPWVPDPAEAETLERHDREQALVRRHRHAVARWIAPVTA